jgi:hypothetical protein
MVSITSAILYGAGICRFLWVRMAKWLRISDSVRYSRVSCERSNTRSHILSQRDDHIVRGDGFNHVRDSIWHRHLPIFQGDRMAELLRPADSVSYSRSSCVGPNTRSHILSSKKDHIVPRDGFNHVRDSIWHRHVVIYQGAGWPSGYGQQTL